jgi:hypothetical protein
MERFVCLTCANFICLIDANAWGCNFGRISSGAVRPGCHGGGLITTGVDNNYGYLEKVENNSGQIDDRPGKFTALAASAPSDP